MKIPELTLEDFLIVPQNDIDIQIWVNEWLEDIKECQPFYYKYLKQLKETYGPQALTSSIFTFLVVNHAIERDYYAG